jgi:GNAT superfamily N-acetyltransferase
MDLSEIRLLDGLAADALPAQLQRPLDGWLLRASPDAPFRRTNSVLALGGGHTGFGDDVTAVETFYATFGLPARFQVSPASQPAELDDLLVARGYAVEAPVVIAIVDAADVAGPRGAVSDGSDPASFRHAAAVFEDDPAAAARIEGFATLLAEGDREAAVAVVDDAAVGIAVADRGWAGIFGMRTRPERRRSGLGRRTVGALAAWAVEQSAARLYLQVEEDNAAARSLYARLGFADAYGYHYRTRFA